MAIDRGPEAGDGVYVLRRYKRGEIREDGGTRLAACMRRSLKKQRPTVSDGVANSPFISCVSRHGAMREVAQGIWLAWQQEANG